MSKLFKKVITLLFVALLVFTTIAYTSCSAKRVVTIAYNPNAYASAVSHIMISDDILNTYLPDDVEVEWVEMSSASDIRDALASGSLDIATPALTAFISAYENNMPIKLISNYGNAQVCLYGCNTIDDISDFESTDIIAIKGLNTNPHIALLAYCKENGLDVEMYNSILNKIPEAETIGMLGSSSEISGAVLSYPITKEADKLSNCKLLIDFSDIIQEYNLGTVVCVNSDFYNQHEDIVNAFEEAHNYIVENWMSDLEHNAQILSNQYDCSTDEVLELMKELPPSMEIIGYDKLADLMYECGMLTQEPHSFDSIINN